MTYKGLICRSLVALVVCACAAAAQETTTVTYIKIPPVDRSPAPDDDVSTDDPLTTETTAAPARKYTRAPARASPRLMSKLSYYSAPAGPVDNLLERFSKEGRRTYRSRCRCAKIWNCPKLQISVPRCPNEYFMCCF